MTFVGRREIGRKVKYRDGALPSTGDDVFARRAYRHEIGVPLEVQARPCVGSLEIPDSHGTLSAGICNGPPSGNEPQTLYWSSAQRGTCCDTQWKALDDECLSSYGGRREQRLARVRVPERALAPWERRHVAIEVHERDPLPRGHRDHAGCKELDVVSTFDRSRETQQRLRRIGDIEDPEYGCLRQQC
jgi:hypothetical protein